MPEYTPRLIARDLDVAQQSVYRWIWDGEIPCTRTITGRIHVAESDYEAFKAARTATA